MAKVNNTLISRGRRVQAFDFTRVLLTYGIVAFHFQCSAGGNLLPFYQNEYVDWGMALVVAFFMLSGGGIVYQ